MATPSSFAIKLASIAEEQHSKFQFVNEADPTLCKQIKKWTKDIGFGIITGAGISSISSLQKRMRTIYRIR